MPGSLTFSEWVVLGIGALLVVGGGLVAGIRALWIYRAPAWLRTTLLSLFAAGIGTAGAGLVVGWESLVIGGLALGIVPFGGWLVARSIFHAGPPPGLLEGPRSLDKADDVLDSVAGMIGLEHTEHSDEDDA